MITGERSLERTRRAIKKVQRQTPAIVGGMAVQYFKDRFKRQGWRDHGFERWADRKKKERGRRRAIGVKTGRLKRSPRVFSKTRNGVFIGTDLPYAKRFNEGYTGQVTQQVRSHRVREHGRRVGGQEQTVSEYTRSGHSRTAQVDQPARPFIGESQFLNRRIEKNIEHQLRKELRFLKNI